MRFHGQPVSTTIGSAPRITIAFMWTACGATPSPRVAWMTQVSAGDLDRVVSGRRRWEHLGCERWFGDDC